MSAAGRPERTPDDVAAGCRDAGFVRLVATADGDALAAVGLLARALGDADVPYQASLAAVPETPATDADYTVSIGTAAGDVALRSEPIAAAAYEIAAEIASGAVDPTLALAGVVCAGSEPIDDLLEAVDPERRPGVAVPTDDPTDLAFSTLIHADFSGDADAIAAALADLEIDGIGADGRRIASYVALSIVEAAPPSAAEAVKRALRPYTCDRFATLGGYADVLDAVARERPGTGIALALGRDLEAAALEAWRNHGRRAHAALRSADTGRYDGIFVARVDEDAPLGTVARLLSAYRSPEPIALAVRDGAAAVAADRPIDEPLKEAAAALEGRATARNGRGAARFEGAATDFVAAFREAL